MLEGYVQINLIYIICKKFDLMTFFFFFPAYDRLMMMALLYHRIKVIYMHTLYTQINLLYIQKRSRHSVLLSPNIYMLGDIHYLFIFRKCRKTLNKSNVIFVPCKRNSGEACSLTLADDLLQFVP